MAVIQRYRRFSVAALLLLISGLITVWMTGNTLSAREIDPPVPAPEFTHNQPDDWINSAPLSLADLRGQVVLIDIWTFMCWNCYRSFPWLNQLESRYHDQGLRVIGVHSPEFDREKVRANIVAKVEEFGLDHSVMIDNDFSYWRALNNRYWPAFYLLDKQGRIRGYFIGETHADSQQARQVAALVEKLLAE